MRPPRREPVDSKERRAEPEPRLDALIEELLRIRAGDPPASDEEIRRHRHEGRP
jgi:hypothetical protein